MYLSDLHGEGMPFQDLLGRMRGVKSRYKYKVDLGLNIVATHTRTDKDQTQYHREFHTFKV